MSAPGPLVLVVEDEAPLRRFLRASLASHDFRVLEAETAAVGETMARTHNPDLILLDLGLPDGDGIELTRRLRTWSRTPILVVSARGREEDKVLGLDAGADDYLTKPFGLAELLARIRVALRHARGGASGADDLVAVGPLRMDLARREATIDGNEVKLTPLEWKLLEFMARNADKVLTHRQILREIWGPGYENRPHYVRVYMAELRKKLEPEPARPRLLLTEPGVGYRLRGSPGA